VECKEIRPEPELAFILPLIEMLTKELEMLPPREGQQGEGTEVVPAE